MTKAVLWCLSKLYQAAVFLRHCAYDCRFLPVKKVPAVVVSVGNVVVGGAGKTPLVHFLAADLSKRYSIAILSRGYQSRAEHRKTPTLVRQEMCAGDVGDEPLWLAKQLPQAQVWVGKNRYASAKCAIENGAEILLLDDGFQHRALHRDLDVVVLSENNGHFLPRGLLRDLPSRLSKASVLVVQGESVEQFPNAVVFERATSVDLQGRRVALFCAIANPNRFFRQVQGRGAEIVSSLFKPDHAAFSPEELQMLYEKSKADILVCTEKDFVKLVPEEVEVPILAVPLELEICSGQEIWAQFINKIQMKADYVRRVSSHAS